jgi:acyl carrier protein
MEKEIQGKIAEYIAVEILKQPQREIRAEEKLISGGLVDSFHLVDLALFVEDTFGVHIDDTELTADTFDTLEELAGLVQERM